MADRDAFAQRQAAFLDALQGRGEVPEGFDADNMAAASASLTRKRAGELALAWPGVSSGLGERYPDLAAAFFRETPPARDAGADGYAFAHWVGRAGLSSAGRVELALGTAARRPYLGLMRDGGGLVLIASVGGGRTLVWARHRGM